MRRPVALLAALGILAAPALAAAGPLQVAVDHTMKLAFSGPAASVVVGNPAVADVHVVDSRTVFVAGRSYGSTDVTIVDSLGRTLFSQEIVVSPPKRGQVAIYRGAARSDFSCDPTCSPNVATAGVSAASPAAPGAPLAAATAAASLPSAVIPQPALSALSAAAGPR